MRTIAVYSLKGGVGKTTFAINLAWSAATQSRRQTLLWDLDPQAAATWLINAEPARRDAAQSVFSREAEISELCKPSGYDKLDLLAADPSLRGLDRLLFDLGKKRRLAKLIGSLEKRYDRAVLDCPPGLTETSEQVLHAADIVIVPVIPSPLSQRALGEVARFLVQRGGKHPPILPVFSMVDQRRTLHREALAQEPKWPVVPMASVIEQMASRRAPIGSYAPSSPAAQSFARLWTAIEKRLSKL